MRYVVSRTSKMGRHVSQSKELAGRPREILGAAGKFVQVDIALL